MAVENKFVENGAEFDKIFAECVIKFRFKLASEPDDDDIGAIGKTADELNIGRCIFVKFKFAKI